jgi:hypothetical protein
MHSVSTDQRPNLSLAHFNQCLDVGYTAKWPVNTISLAFCVAQRANGPAISAVHMMP